MNTEKKIVGHSIEAFLVLTGSWIYTQITGLKRWGHVVACQERLNRDIFPLDTVYSFDDFSTPRQYLQKVGKKLTGSSIYPYQYSAFKKHGARLVHSHFGNKGYKDIPLCRKLKIPHIITFYGYDISLLPVSNPEWKTRYLELFKEGTLFLVEGSEMKNSLLAAGCPEEKIRVQHLGVDLDKITFVRRELKRDEKVRVLVAGTFREKKGIPYALEAFGMVRDKIGNIELTLIGDSTGQPRDELEKKKILEIIEKYQMEKSVRMLGFQPYSVLLEEARAHHIFLSPSVRAGDGDTEGGSPVSITEASASGMPVLSTTHCDIPEVVIDGKSGFLVDERESEALAEKLEYLALNPLLWEKIGRAGREHIFKNYNIKTQVSRLEKIYDSVT